MKAPGLFLALALIAACSGERVAEEGPPPLYKYNAMKEAVAEARQTLPVFWDALQSGDPAYSDFALNVTQGRSGEAEADWRPRPRPVPLPARLTEEEAAAHAEFIGKLGDDALWKRFG